WAGPLQLVDRRRRSGRPEQGPGLSDRTWSHLRRARRSDPDTQRSSVEELALGSSDEDASRPSSRVLDAPQDAGGDPSGRLGGRRVRRDEADELDARAPPSRRSARTGPRPPRCHGDGSPPSARPSAQPPEAAEDAVASAHQRTALGANEVARLEGARGPHGDVRVVPDDAWGVAAPLGSVDVGGGLCSGPLPYAGAAGWGREVA